MMEPLPAECYLTAQLMLSEFILKHQFKAQTMPSISFPSGPTNFGHLPLEIKEQIVHHTVNNVLTASDVTSHGSQQVTSPANNTSTSEKLRNQSNRLFSLMNVSTEFMMLTLNDLHKNSCPHVEKSLNVVALNSILRKRNPEAFEDLMRNMLRSATYIDLSHRSVAFALSSKRLEFIVNQLATASANNLQTATLHLSTTKEWDYVKEKIAQIHKANPKLSIHISFSEKTEPGAGLPPRDLSDVLSKNENIKGMKVFRVHHVYRESPAQFFSFLPASSINELTIQRVSIEDFKGLKEVLLVPGCKVNTLNLGKEQNNPLTEAISELSPALENQASPLQKIQLHGPWRTHEVIPLLTAAGNDNSPLKELEFSGISGKGISVRAIQDQVAQLISRGVKITLWTDM